MSPLDDLGVFLVHAVVLEDEAEHAAALEEWLQRYPPPANAWDEDLDPPAEVD
ncbi:MAG: hypothetical protein ACNA8J_05035 [Gammaproteobacteria bacterium]